ncbi:serine hydrolase [Fodinibius sp. SL11]|uniref:serine hydrolase n=1 Tax=Fodinibius sp. SL11 TaxID=3425690 RepID=UPI003F880B82
MLRPSFTSKLPHSEFSDMLDERIPRILNNYAIPGVNIALIREGNLIWNKSYGYANLQTQQPMTTETYCRVESISKSVPV